MSPYLGICSYLHRIKAIFFFTNTNNNWMDDIHTVVGGERTLGIDTVSIQSNAYHENIIY